MSVIGGYHRLYLHPLHHHGFVHEPSLPLAARCHEAAHLHPHPHRRPGPRAAPRDREPHARAPCPSRHRVPECPRERARSSTTQPRAERRSASMNTAFAELRELIPHVPADTKLSRIKTLRLAAGYIAHLTHVLHAHTGAPGLARDTHADGETGSRCSSADLDAPVTSAGSCFRSQTPPPLTPPTYRVIGGQ